MADSEQVPDAPEDVDVLGALEVGLVELEELDDFVVELAELLVPKLVPLQALNDAVNTTAVAAASTHRCRTVTSICSLGTRPSSQTSPCVARESGECGLRHTGGSTDARVAAAAAGGSGAVVGQALVGRPERC